MAVHQPSEISKAAAATVPPVIILLKREGACDVAKLAAKLGITPAGVRQQLADLSAQGLVASASGAPTTGRPAKIWRLTEAANRFFPSAHAEFTLRFLNGARNLFGSEGITQIIRQVARAQIEDYRPALESQMTLGDKVRALAGIRNRDGYMAECQPAPDGSFLLVENHCPVSKVAKSCSVICEAEFDVFKEILGKGIKVERQEHLVAGQRRCVYCISERRESRSTEADAR